MRKICIISLISHLLNYSFNIRSEINHHLVSIFPTGGSCYFTDLRRGSLVAAYLCISATILSRWFPKSFFSAFSRAISLALGPDFSVLAVATVFRLDSICWKYFQNIFQPRLTLRILSLTCIELQVVGRPPMRCLRSGGRMLSRILFSCSRAAEEGPRLLTTLEAEMTMDDFTDYWTVVYCIILMSTELYTGWLVCYVLGNNEDLSSLTGGGQ